MSRRRPLLFSLGAASLLALVSACADDFDTTRSPPARGTTGTELYGVFCDRVGAQALPEDLTGASFQAICHQDASGNWGSQVDQSLLPAADPNALDVNGNPVSVATQNANRLYAVNRVEAMGRDRANMIAALDATFPAIQVPIKDTGNSDPTQSCGVPTSGSTDTLSHQLTEMLGRFQVLYTDGTIPQSTEALSRVFNAIQASPDAQQSFARFEARQGYRPIELGLGAARPIIADPSLRDLTNAALALLSADSQPYNTSNVDAQGNRIPIPGPANPQFAALIAASHNELLYAAADPILPILRTSVDPTTGRTALTRARTDLETLETLFYAKNAAFGNVGATPSFIALRDPRGYAQVHAVNGVIPAPFVDANKDGLADVDDLGSFVTTTGQPPPSPFFAVDATYGARDACGRALLAGAATAGDDAGVSSAAKVRALGKIAASSDASTNDASATDDGGDAALPTSTPDSGASTSTACGGVSPDALLYDYLDTSHVFATTLMSDLKPFANPDTTAAHETLMYLFAGLPVVMGTRDGSPLTSKCYATGATGGSPSSCSDPNSVLTYNAFQTTTSPMLDLVYTLGQMLADPTMDDTLSYASALFANHTNDLARLVGDGLTMKANAGKHPEAKIPATSTFWDEMIDVSVALEQEPGLLEDVLRALGADGSQQLGTIFANYMQFNDKMSYDPTNLNGPVFNVTTGAPGDMQTAVDRTQADTGFNRSAMQRFLQAVHDTDGVTACNKAGAVVHAQGVELLGSVDICGGGISGGGATCSVPILDIDERPFTECEVFKIDNLAKFYLDAIVGKANLYFRPSILRNGLCIGSLCLGAATVGVIEQSSGIGYSATNANAVNDGFGFWDPTSAGTFRPRPQWLNRLVFFDQTVPTSDPNYSTAHFLADLNGQYMGTSVCPERLIPDPCASEDCGGNDALHANVASDGQVHGLRTCADGDNLQQRDADTLFVWEDFGFYQAITPLLSAFVNHGREDLFINLMEVLDRHWQDAKGTADECLLSSDPNATNQKCDKDGLVTYEPLLVDQFNTDILPALHDLEPTLEAQTIPTCATVDPKSGACTAEATKDGIAVLSAATRALLDPVQALGAGLKDRSGSALGLRNDGTANPQVTPIYLLTEALNGMDAAFAKLPASTTDDRLAQWRTARSQIVDEFLTVNGATTGSTFNNAAVPAFVPVLVDVLRAQLGAYCPTSFNAAATITSVAVGTGANAVTTCTTSAPHGYSTGDTVFISGGAATGGTTGTVWSGNGPWTVTVTGDTTFTIPTAGKDLYTANSANAVDESHRCTWARDTLTTEMTNVIHGPIFAGAMDVLEAARTDAPTRAQMEQLLTYLLNAASSNEALPNTLASADDMIQLLKDDTNLVPLYHALSTGLEATQTNAQGQITQKSVVDAELSLLGRLSGRSIDANGTEICANEIDPNQVLTLSLGNLVTPMTNADGTMGEAPLQAIMDVIGDVNRADPSQLGKFAGPDYANIANNVSDFMLDKYSGLEQFYQIVRNGTSNQ